MKTKSEFRNGCMAETTTTVVHNCKRNIWYGIEIGFGSSLEFFLSAAAETCFSGYLKLFSFSKLLKLFSAVR